MGRRIPYYNCHNPIPSTNSHNYRNLNNIEKKYKVQYWQDGDYAVFKVEEDESGMVNGELGSALIIGSLADCEAYIRLHEGGYMN